jgi:exodeoxyribonuclease VII small subunit
MPKYPDRKATTKRSATSESATPDAASLSFEDALQELDEVVSQLEAGNVPLEDSLVLLRRGHELAAKCDKTLGNAESVLEQLTLSANGELIAQRLQWVDEDDEEDDSEDEGDE